MTMSDVTLPLTYVTTCSPFLPGLMNAGSVLVIACPFFKMKSLNNISMSCWDIGRKLSKQRARGGSASPRGRNVCTPPSSDRTKTAPKKPEAPSHSAKASELLCRVPANLPFVFISCQRSDAYFKCPAAPITFPLHETTKAPSFGLPSSFASDSAASGSFWTRRSNSLCCHLSDEPCPEKASSSCRNGSRRSCRLLATDSKHRDKCPPSKWLNRMSSQRLPSTIAMITPPIPSASISATETIVLRACSTSGCKDGTCSLRSLRSSSNCTLSA
mmetsp:Transcript_74394/g.206556  ORF Transcript_74394/g.206556 Transcript_74394/m.206556 type:complete len:272 (-) Transcript_74394:575-1390(-)